MNTGVLVVGGGLAGATAALAARAAGKDVTLVARAPGLTALSSGAFEAAPDPGAGADAPFGRGRTVGECVEALARRSHHPYAVVGARGRARLPDAFDGLARALAPAGLALSAYEGNRPSHYLVSSAGVPRPAAVAEASMVGLDLARGDGVRLGVLALTRVASVDPELRRRGLAGLPGDWQVVPVVADWPGDADAPYLLPADLGRRLDDPAGRAALVAALRPVLEGQRLTHLLLPPVAGTRDAAKITTELSRTLGLTVVEAPGGEASLPGLRLHRALGRALEAAGVSRIVGTVHAAGGALSLARPGAGPEAIEAEALVLATGRYLGGGVVRHGAYAEPVLGLPIFAEARWLEDEVMANLTTDDPWAPQAAFHAGLRTDARLRPLGRDGRPVRPDVFAAGAVLEGYDGPRDRCGGGVAVLTGHLAGRLAAGAEIT